MTNPTSRRKGRKGRRTQDQGQGLQMDPQALQEARAGLGMVDAQVAGLMAGVGATVGAADGVDFDFDRHWKAKTTKAQPRRVRIKGTVYTLPGSMPAGVLALAMRREFADPNRELAPTEALQLTMDMLASALGKAQVAQMMDEGITMDEFPDVLAYVMGNFDELGMLRDGDEPAGAPDPGEADGGRRPAISGT